MAGIHYVGTLTFFIIINVFFQIVYSTPTDDVANNTESVSDRLVGAPSSIDVNDSDITRYASLGLAEVSKVFEGTNEPLIVEILSATSQVVAGTLYKIQIKVGTSDCPKGTKQNCRLLDDSETPVYEISAWSRPWLGEDGLDITVKSIVTATNE